ncbi:carotenoid 1,2-hydratase [Leptospira levettii]|uniref:lipocalin-like domain-containing protein n=1 Tax=Leptospira levettii TaxID=2023178 RepID=UPI001083CA17|nr:lipocalin-like domain-containing protein [Leptospira levettii]TGL18272.1 carotenoid 1,2-hydratase [Leptospira levettii]
MNQIKVILLSLCFFHFSFPKDHSFHSDFSLEWCYFVGQLQTESGNSYGYELSFFRLKFSDDENWNPELFPVHFAISDLSGRKHKTAQTIKRDLSGLAGYDQSRIYSGEYEFQILSKDKFLIKAKPKSNEIAIEFTLEGDGNILSQGKNGISIKSKRNPNIFSYYYSYPRLKTKGQLVFLGKKETIVSGNSWMDHEWSEKSSQNIPTLAKGQSGWDWICLMDERGGDYVFFRFREAPEQTPEIFGTYRDAKGKVTYWNDPKDIQMVPIGTSWKSNQTKITYPLHWKIKYPGGEWIVSPIFNEQEFDGSVSTKTIYWEGAVLAKDPMEKKSAKGYLELKGYQKSKDWWEF